LPGDNTKKENGEIIALRYGLSEISDNIAR
jgi:hypothetical protein